MKGNKRIDTTNPRTKGSKPGRTPVEWVKYNFADVVEIDSETLGPNIDGDYSFRYVSLSDVDKGVIKSNLPQWSYSDSPSRARRIVRKGDILFSTVRPNLQSFAIIKEEVVDLIASTGFAVLRPKRGFTTDYIYQYLYTHHLSKQVNELITGSNYPAISSSDVSELKILIPKQFPEQQKIARILSTWDKAIEKTEQLIGQKQKLKKGLMQQLLSGKKRVPGFDSKWRKVKLDKLGEFSKGSGISKAELVQNGIPCIRYGELYTTHEILIKQFHSFISRESANLSKQLSSGDILFAGSGETAEEIGKCSVFIGDQEVYAGGDIIILRPSPENDPLFLSYLLNSDGVNKQKSSMGKGHSVVHIYPSDLKRIEIEIPGIEEQIVIGEILLKAGDEIELYKQRLGKLTYIKKGLMQKLLTGEIRTK